MKHYFRDKNVLVENTRKIMKLSSDEGSILIRRLEEFHQHCTEGMDLSENSNPLLNELITRGIFLKMLNNEILHKREIEDNISFDNESGIYVEHYMWIKEKAKLYRISFSYPKYYIGEYLIKKDENGIYPELQATITIDNMNANNYNSITLSSCENPKDNFKTGETVEEGMSLYRVTKSKRYVRGNEVFEEEFIRHLVKESEENKKPDILERIKK